MNQLVKLILIGILILCFFKMPSLFYRLSSYLLLSGFGWLAYEGFKRRNKTDVKIFTILTILYNPFFTIPLPHILSIVINTLVIIGIILNLLFAEDNPYEDNIKKDDH